MTYPSNGNDLKMQMNRSFKFGDGLFETMRWHQGQIFNLDLHFNRLKQGLNVLGIEAGADFDLNSFRQLISKHIAQKNYNANSPTWRVRISCFRGGGGLYTPLKNNMEWLIEAEPLEASDFVLNKLGLKLGYYPEVTLSCDILSNLKTTSALSYVMAARYRQEQAEIDDCILLNQYGRVAETIAANLFYRIGNQIFTPGLSEGCVAGTMRQWLINQTDKLGVNCLETQIEMKDLRKAEEIFLTNAIQGVRWVEKLSWETEKQFNSELSQQIVQQLNLQLELCHKA